MKVTRIFRRTLRGLMAVMIGVLIMQLCSIAAMAADGDGADYSQAATVTVGDNTINVTDIDANTGTAFSYFKFTALSSADYTFTSQSASDTYGKIFTTNPRDPITANDDANLEPNHLDFSLTATLAKGETYYLEILDYDGPNEITLHITGGSPQSSSISPVQATSDKYNPSDISTAMTLNGNTLSCIKTGSDILTEGTDYSVDSTTGIVTISSALIKKFNLDEDESLQLTFYFSQGDNQTFVIAEKEAASSVPNGVSAATVTSVTRTSAQAGGTVISDGGALITERGILYSKTADPELNGAGVSKVTAAGTTGTFVAEISELAANTTYYARAYATNGRGTSYGPVMSFTTPAPPATVTDVTITPGGVSVARGGSLTLTAIVAGTYNPSQAVTWSVAGGTAGTTITNGVLSVSSAETASTLIIRATSDTDSTKYCEITVKILSWQKDITGTAIGELAGGTVTNVPYGTTVSNLKAALTVSPKATVEILTDYSVNHGSIVANQTATQVATGMVIKVIAEDGSSWEYPITVKPPITYQVYFFNNKGDETPAFTELITLGDKAAAPTNPNKSGYIFGSWYNGAAKWDFNNEVTSNLTLIAQWTAVPVIPIPPVVTPPAEPEKTIEVIEAPQDIKNQELISIKPVGDAFTQPVEVKLEDSPEVKAAIEKALIEQFNKDLANAKIFPLNISLYLKGTDTKVQPASKTSVLITIPIPNALLADRDSIKVVCMIDGKLTVLDTAIVSIDGVYCVQFAATHFSPYAMVVDKDDALSNTKSEQNPKTGGNSPIIPLVLFTISSFTMFETGRKGRKFNAIKK